MTETGSSADESIFTGLHNVRPKPLKTDFHHIAISKLNSGHEAEGVSAEEMNVQISGSTIGLEFEMVMLDVAQRRHISASPLLICSDQGTRPPRSMVTVPGTNLNS